MIGSQVSMLVGAAAYSLVSMVIVFFVAQLALTIFVKPRPSAMRLIIAFMISWAAVSFYLPFKGVAHYMHDSGELYIAELIVAVVALLAVTKLSPTNSSRSPGPKA